MATKEYFCDPCLEVKSTVAVKYCSDCEEYLCDECVESHRRFKAFKSHHLIDLSSVGSKIPSYANMRCEIHNEVQLDFYCSHHEAVCCRVCIPDQHSSCNKIYPLDVASKIVRKFALLSDTFDDLINILETLDKLLTSREVNITSLVQSKSSITRQIRMVKEQIVRKLDAMEEKVIAEVSVVEEKHISAIKKENVKISKLASLLKSKIEELKFLKEHGSNNQLFLALQKQIVHTHKTEKQVQEMLSSIKETDIKFEENKDLEFESFGSITEITRPCDITYTTYKSQQSQVQQGTVTSLTELKRDGEVKLKSGEKYSICGMAVTEDNKLLHVICNYLWSCPKFFIYKDCKTFESKITLSSLPYDVAVIPCSHTAVITLPLEDSIQFINTTNNTVMRKVNIRIQCHGVMATKDRIVIGEHYGVHIFGTDGSEVTQIITEGGLIHNLHYNEHNDQILIRQNDKLRCIDLNGKVVYQYKISGCRGLAVDRDGDVYISGGKSNDIHRLSSDGTVRDIVLNESDGIKKPGFLSFRQDFKKLFVVCANNESVLVYNCK